MKIVCLGWGSLVWNSRELEIPQEKWNKDGPLLPVEFTRFSSDGRVTLIIDEEASDLNVLWADMTQKELQEATCVLSTREGTKHNKIYKVAVGDSVDNDKQKLKIVKWLKEKNRDAAIWTGLGYGKDKKRPTHEEVINHLRGLDCCDKRRAEEYIRKTPTQIDTPYRRKIEAVLGWTPRN
jgi:hypothetical protein